MEWVLGAWALGPSQGGGANLARLRGRSTAGEGYPSAYCPSHTRTGARACCSENMASLLRLVLNSARPPVPPCSQVENGISVPYFIRWQLQLALKWKPTRCRFGARRPRPWPTRTSLPHDEVAQLTTRTRQPARFKRSRDSPRPQSGRRIGARASVANALKPHIRGHYPLLRSKFWGRVDASYSRSMEAARRPEESRTCRPYGPHTTPSKSQPTKFASLTSAPEKLANLAEALAKLAPLSRAFTNVAVISLAPEKSAFSALHPSKNAPRRSAPVKLQPRRSRPTKFAR